MKRTTDPGDVCGRLVKTIKITVNLEQKTEQGFKHLFDELIFNMEEETPDDVLKSLGEVIGRGDMHSIFISVANESVMLEEIESLSEARGWEFREQ